MFYLLIVGAKHFNAQLVQRIIETTSHADWPPGIATLHQALHPSLFSLFAVGFLLSLILQLEQQPLLVECLNSVHDSKVQSNGRRSVQSDRPPHQQAAEAHGYLP